MHVKVADMHGRLHWAASGFKGGVCCSWIRVKMVSGYWFWSRVRTNPMLTGSSGSGSYGSMIVSSEFSAPWWGFLFQVFLSCQISLMSSTCPFPPVPGCLHLLLLWALIQFHYLCQTSSISGCFAWFLGWLWAGLDSGESCEPTAPWIKLLKHSPTGFPAFWILSVVTVEGVMYLWVSNNRCQ